MKNFTLLSSLILFFLFSSSLMASQEECKNGECVENILTTLENLGKVYEETCLPSEAVSDLEKYYLENGLTEECWKYLSEINHLEKELSDHRSRLKVNLSCGSGTCKMAGLPEENIPGQLTKLAIKETELTCSSNQKKEIKDNCKSDMTCVLAASAAGLGGYSAERLFPEKSKLKNCHLGNDSCLTQLGTSFLKTSFTFFEGSWDLLKLAGNKIGEKMNDFWSWVTEAEDHASTSQLALAQASEEPGFFDMLVSDFPGTMIKVWEALVTSLKDWLKKDIFCKKWEAIPHFSKCLNPSESFDCIGCKAMVTGLCGISGTLVSEVIPAFLTGGLFTAAKYGASGAAKISSLFKLSDKGLAEVKSLKLSHLGPISAKVLKTTKSGISKTQERIGLYLINPTRKKISSSLAVLNSLTNKGLSLGKSSSGDVLLFTGKALKNTGKVIIYPIDNPMTAFAFKAGQRSFDKFFTLGHPKLAASSGVVTALRTEDPELERLVIQLETTKVSKESTPEEVLKLEEKLRERLIPKRQQLLKAVLQKKDLNLDEMIKYLYPELKYGKLAKKLSTEELLKAEEELFLEISHLKSGAKKEDLLKKYHFQIVQGEARSRVLNNSPTTEEILRNSELKQDERLVKALKIIKRAISSEEEKNKLALTLQKAHNFGEKKGVFEYSWSELREKYRILVDGGFSKLEANDLIRFGIAGKPPVRELLEPQEMLFSNYSKDIIKGKYLEKREELTELIYEQNPVRNSFEIGAEPSFDGERIRETIDSLYFIDYNHSLPELNSFLLGKKEVADSALADRYGRKSFDNFKDTRSYLLEEKPPLNKSTFLDIHKRMMKDKVDGVHPEKLGIIRGEHWIGTVPEKFPINEAVIKEIQNNPYLTWVVKGKTEEGKYFGELIYPNVASVKKEALALIKDKHPKLVIEVEEYQRIARSIDDKDSKLSEKDLQALQKRHEELVKNKTEITKKVIDAMVDERMTWFTGQRKSIGKINTLEKLDKYIDLLAEFQRDLISIHPLTDGNGRVTREFALSYALMREGFPPPRLLDQEADMYKSKDEWKNIIKHGILASDFLVDDLSERIRYGLPLENSLHLTTPYTPSPMKMMLKDGKKLTPLEKVEFADPRFYREIVKREVASNPAFEINMKSDPVKAWDEIHKEAEKTFLRNNIYYKHPQKGVERVELSYVDDDFKALFGEPTYDDYEVYEYKMKNWYSDDITWRGLASKGREKSEKEIIDMFKTLSPHNASNAIIKKTRDNPTPEAVKAAALEDFERFNNDVFGDGLVAMARDHSESGPMYGMSYGYSTSKSREVGKAFAMGAMVVAEYGAHKAPELQSLLKSRVLVGARRANKDVDLGRLKQVRDEFSYKYGRQQEVMGIGATDPDAVTIVQTIDAEGEVIQTYLRNSIKPDQIWVIKGDFSLGKKPKFDQIIKTINLRN